MIKFNDDNIFVGYIKQLLTTFNLPKPKIYTAEQQKYHNWYLSTAKERTNKLESLKEEKECWESLLLAPLVEPIPEDEKKNIDDNIARIDEEIKKLNDITPEKNVLITIFRNTADDYDVLASNMNLLVKEQSTLKSEETRLINKIADLEVEISETPEGDEKIRLQIELATEQDILKSTQERLSQIADILARTNIYPEKMRYIHYIKDGKVQEYAPKIDNNGNVIYSDNDWKICHAQFGDAHEELHKVNGVWSLRTRNYSFGIKDLNYTKNLIIQNTLYDSYTHEYLGDYLRFLRDYKQVNLMPLYNCFSNRVCSQLKLSFDVGGTTIKFDTTDSKYKIYMVPIKFFQKYTIAIDSGAAVELCCGLYGKYQETADKYTDIAKQTYKCYNNLLFRTPVLYDPTEKLNSFLGPADKTELAQREQDLKLFIKVPINNASSIVVLEGDYTAYDDSVVVQTIKQSNKNKKARAFYKDNPRMLPEAYELYEYLIKPFIEAIELSTTTPKQRAKAKQILGDILNGRLDASIFPSLAVGYYSDVLAGKIPQDELIPTAPAVSADKLMYLKSRLSAFRGDSSTGTIGYNEAYLNNLSDLKPAMLRETNKIILNFDGNYEELLTNLITPLQLLRTNTGISYPFADRLVEYLIGNAITPLDEIYDNTIRAKEIVTRNVNSAALPIVNDGIWVSALQAIFYEYINEEYDLNDINHDILGFVDKDVEKLYSATSYVTKTVKGEKVKEAVVDTISNVNIYDEWKEED